MLRVSGQIPKLTRQQLKRRCRLSTESAKAENVPTPKPAAPQQNLPPGGGTGGAGGVFAKILGLSILGTGGVIGYAYYDPNFRKQIEDYVPSSKDGFKYLFEDMLGKKAVEPEAKSSKTSSIDSIESHIEEVQQKSLIRKKTATEAPSKEENAKQEDERKKNEQEEKKRQDEEKVRQALFAKQADEAMENAALESILESMSTEAKELVTLAIEAQNSAAECTKEHSETLKKAMDMSEVLIGKEGEWEEVTKALERRQGAVSAADKLKEDATILLEKLKAAVADGKEGSATKKNKAITTAEETLSSLSYNINTAAGLLKKAEGDAKVMQEYRDLVKKGRDQFKKELESVMPEVKIGKRFGGKLTEEELNALIAHAHRRLEQLQRQIVERQVTEQQRLETALQQQREQDSRAAQTQLETELQRSREQTQLQKQIWDAENRVQFEQELRQHLSRAAAAHSDHLADVLHVQQRELEARCQAVVHERVLQERDQFHTETASYIARLDGIETAVDARADLEKQFRQSQELWLAVQSLHAILTHGSSSSDSQLEPLEPQLSAITAAGANHPFVHTMIEAVPEQAAKRGVLTEDALSERFNKVHAICRRVALIDETGGSLFKFFLSYMQALMVFAAKPIAPDASVTVGEMSVFHLLDNAKYCIEKGDLEQAVRFMNQLNGEARTAARDWVTEARLLLETKQAATALLAHASAQGIGSLMK